MKKLALLMGIALGSLNSFSQETRQPKTLVKDTVLELRSGTFGKCNIRK